MIKQSGHRCSGYAAVWIGALAMLLACAARAEVRINEILANPPGANDFGREYIEYLSDTPNESMNGLRLIIVEGDTHEDDVPIPPARIRTGRIEQVINYDGLTTGANRLLLHRDTTAVLQPPPHPDTRVLVRPFVNYTDPPNPPDNTIENNAQTYFLVRMKPGQEFDLGEDLDLNDDGVIETGPGSIWATKVQQVVDAFGIFSEQGDAVTGRVYARQFGGVQMGNDVFTPDLCIRLPNRKWIAMDVFGSGNGPYPFDPNEIMDEVIVNGMNRFCVFDGQASPGNHNEFPRVRVSGTVALEQCSPNVPLVFELRPDDGLPTITRTVTPTASGAWSLTDVPIQHFTLWVKGPKWLANAVPLDAAAGDVTGVRVGTLLGGDANNDNFVDVLDLSALIESFDTSSGDPGWNNGVADFNCDGAVDVLDLDLLIRNFDLSGAP
ncbi:MAG: dockerin type I domain-containing protein [Chloroherpetonaceae bacterium]|nr:dockerin type I domain-containing protein [Chthonomonadaceae bacterium]MDW8209126.1 dockerin type I domain-containing protein [Chloroherpetonaceae bacterium]